MQRKQWYLTAGCIVLGAASIWTTRWGRSETPLSRPNATLPNISQPAHIRAALRQTAELVAFLKANGNDPFKVPESLGRLPDARFADQEPLREPGQFSYSFPSLNLAWNHPLKGKVLVVSQVYYRTNPARYRGDRVKFDPEGVFLVGWADGHVEAVPAEAVRMVRFGTGKHFTRVFPGMKEWKADGIRLPEFEFAQGQGRAEARAFYQAVHYAGQVTSG